MAEGEFWGRFLERAYRMAIEAIERLEANRIFPQRTDVIVAFTIDEVLRGLGMNPDDPQVAETFRKAMLEKGSGGRLEFNYADARIEIRRSVAEGARGIVLAPGMPPLRWVYVHLPLSYYDKARKRLLEA